MKILGKETRRNSTSMLVLYVVDSLDSEYTVSIKNSFFKSQEAYKKHIYTNGTTEKISSYEEKEYLKINFKLNDGDWLIIEEENTFSMYISEPYCGPIKVHDKKVQKLIDNEYHHCRERINSKREFAKDIGIVSRRLNIPFQIVLAFKGNEELLKQLIKNIEQTIENELYNNNFLMELLSSKELQDRVKALQHFGITNVPSFQADKLAEYLLECLKAQKVIRRYG